MFYLALKGTNGWDFYITDSRVSETFIGAKNFSIKVEAKAVGIRINERFRVYEITLVSKK